MKKKQKRVYNVILEVSDTYDSDELPLKVNDIKDQIKQVKDAGLRIKIVTFERKA